MLRWLLMQLSDLYLRLGQPALPQLLTAISMGSLRTYQLFDRLRIRAHLQKLNAVNLRGAAPKLWARLESGDQELALDLAQAILVSHMDMIQAVLDSFGIPHEEGFFAKDLDAKQYLKDAWIEKAYLEFKERFQPAVLLFYLNHLNLELFEGSAEFYAPAA